MPYNCIITFKPQEMNDFYKHFYKNEKQCRALESLPVHLFCLYCQFHETNFVQTLGWIVVTRLLFIIVCGVDVLKLRNKFGLSFLVWQGRTKDWEQSAVICRISSLLSVDEIIGIIFFFCSSVIEASRKYLLWF